MRAPGGDPSVFAIARFNLKNLIGVEREYCNRLVSDHGQFVATIRKR